MLALPAPGVEHVLLINEPVDLAELRGTSKIAFTLEVFVLFRELERLVESTLGRNPDNIGYSVGISLWGYAPIEHRYVVIDAEDDHAKTQNALRELIRLCDFYLEPIRRKLESLSAFDSSDARPSKASYWHWSIRRAAYYQLFQEEERKKMLFASLRQEAQSELDKVSAEEDLDERFFSSIPKMLRTAELRSAKELLKVIGTFQGT